MKEAESKYEIGDVLESTFGYGKVLNIRATWSYLIEEPIVEYNLSGHDDGECGHLWLYEEDIVGKLVYEENTLGDNNE